MTKIKVGLLQMSCEGSPSQNMEKAYALIREAAARGAQILCTPELFGTSYFCREETYEPFKLAEPIPGPISTKLSELASELGVVILASLFEKRASGVFHNTVAVLDADGAFLGKYRKMHIPDDPGYYEKFYFTPGDLGYRSFSTRFGRIGVLICWDQWYPEAARITALMGAEMLFYPTAIGWARSQDEQTNREQFQAWQLIQRSHAIANGLPVISVNRVGREEDMTFWGGSFLTNAFGSLIYQAPSDRQEVIVQELDTGDSGHYRTHWPFLRDRRVDSYQPILQRYID